jgi:hypothetical protein
MTMASNDAAIFNQRSRPLGYETRIINGSYFVYRLDNPDRMRAFRERQHLEEFIELLEQTPSWRLDLDHGDVDVDRNTGIVTPRNGDAPFDVRDAQGWSGSRSRLSNDPRLNANYLHIYSQQRPPYGGAWHKWGGL